MTTATAETLPPGRETAPDVAALADLLVNLQPGRRVTVAPMDWDAYEYLLAVRDESGRRGVRLTYDRGSLELMPTTNLHERLKKILALLIEAWLAETGADYLPSGGLTIRRKDLQRGFEPDECYYVQNWRKVAGLRELDFTTDPPPDLTVEAEVTRPVDSRLPVFAAFRIPEVWRYDGERVTVLLLGPDGTYQSAAASRAIPNFPFADAPRFLTLAESVEVSFAAIDRQFRAWVRSLPATPTT